MDSFSIVMTVLAGITSILSITFAILAFGRNKNKDSVEETKEKAKENLILQTRLTQIEKDVSYIRLSLDEQKGLRVDFEQRLRILENK